MNISSKRIKSLRAEHGWSQEQLGEVAGISYRTIQRIEKDGNCSPESQMALASAFGLSPDELTEEYKESIGTGSLNYGGFIGLLLCFFFLGLEFLLPGSKVIFFDFASLLLVIGLTFALSSMTSGIRMTLETLALVKWFVFESNHVKNAQIYLPVLRKLIVYLYSSGAVSTLIGLVAVFTYPQEDNPNILLGVAISFLTLVYGAIFAEFIIRPLKNRIAHMLTV